MKAIGYLTSQDITAQDSLVDIDQPMPVATGRDLLVKVNAISVNPVDTKVRKNVQPENGDYKVLGWDAVGEVVAVGEQVQFYNKGDKVWYAGDLTRPGTNSEYHLVDEQIVGHKPTSISDAEAAALPLTTITAWELLFDRLGLAPCGSAHASAEQQVLIIGAAGGVGSIIVQLAARLTDAVVIGTASRPESQQWVTACGADIVIDHRKPLQEELNKVGLSSVTHVVSLNGTTEHFDSIAEVIAPQGKFALIDDPDQPLDIMKLKMKSVSLHWECMYTRSMFNTSDIAKQRDLLNEVAGLIDAAEIKTTRGEHFGPINAENLKRAHIAVESGTVIGKIVLEGFGH